MVYNEDMVNTMLRKTSNGLERQKIAVANINLFLAVSHKKKKDLAECMDKVPQALSKMLQNKQTWFFEDMCNAADFFNVSIDTLVRTDLTPFTAEQILKTAASDESKNGGIAASNEWGRRGLNPGPGDYESHALTD
ncbi:putative transcriptional regulator [Bifidobacterium reuteri DSM 23975]|uniref:Putative transcriptional regulator n=1 Tax=Bifidobacterium reuteri DSM 23975 TaxID=1437610 RepID=A0A087CMG6_9BIFI|nr:putative transcriptional regulator [Bifidobacterium reuteri DSM 23975]